MSDYQYTIKHRLTTEEYKALWEEHWPVLRRLSARYLPDFDISRGVPCHVGFIDVLRGKWLLDKATDRPPYTEIVSGVGFAFGLLLAEMLGMEWCLIEDTFGEDISLIKFSTDSESEYKEMSVPPFNYVAKRETTQNVEVFTDGIREFEKMMKAKKSESSASEGSKGHSPDS